MGLYIFIALGGLLLFGQLLGILHYGWLFLHSRKIALRPLRPFLDARIERRIQERDATYARKNSGLRGRGAGALAADAKAIYTMAVSRYCVSNLVENRLRIEDIPHATDRQLVVYDNLKTIIDMMVSENDMLGDGMRAGVDSNHESPRGIKQFLAGYRSKLSRALQSADTDDTGKFETYAFREFDQIMKELQGTFPSLSKNDPTAWMADLVWIELNGLPEVSVTEQPLWRLIFAGLIVGRISPKRLVEDLRSTAELTDFDFESPLFRAAEQRFESVPLQARLMALISGLSHREEHVRMACADRLMFCEGSPEVTAAMIGALKDPSEAVRWRAAMHIWSVGCCSGADQRRLILQALLRAQASETDSEIQTKLAQAIENFHE